MGRAVERVLAVIGLLFLVYHLGFEVSVMTSESMDPTLQGTAYENGDWILVEKISHWFRSPKRWDIVMFAEESVPVMKRVVGLPGERIYVKGKKVFINGKEIPIPAHLSFLKYYPYGCFTGGRTLDCGAGYCVLGDNSRDSNDSRYIGPVTADQFRGRPWLIVRPLSRFGFVR